VAVHLYFFPSIRMNIMRISDKLSALHVERSSSTIPQDSDQGTTEDWCLPHRQIARKKIGSTEQSARNDRPRLSRRHRLGSRSCTQRRRWLTAHRTVDGDMARTSNSKDTTWPEYHAFKPVAETLSRREGGGYLINQYSEYECVIEHRFRGIPATKAQLVQHTIRANWTRSGRDGKGAARTGYPAWRHSSASWSARLPFHVSR